MRNFLIKLGWGLLTILGLESLMGCEKQPEQADAYGVPYSTYEIKGKVIDKQTKEPVKGIKIYRHNAVPQGQNGTLRPALNDTGTDSTITSNGEFEFKGTRTGFHPETSFIRIKDMNPDTDGFYLEQTTKISLEKTENPKKNISWNQGSFKAENIIIEIESVKK